MHNEHSSFLSRWFQEVWNNNSIETEESNEKAIEAIHKLIADDAIVHGITEENHLRGVKAFMPFYTDFRSKFSNITVTLEDVTSEDDRESARCILKAIDRKSGRNVEFAGEAIVRLQNGKIVEAWNHFDFDQLGYQLASPQV